MLAPPVLHPVRRDVGDRDLDPAGRAIHAGWFDHDYDSVAVAEVCGVVIARVLRVSAAVMITVVVAITGHRGPGGEQANRDSGEQ